MGPRMFSIPSLPDARRFFSFRQLCLALALAPAPSRLCLALAPDYHGGGVTAEH